MVSRHLCVKNWRSVQWVVFLLALWVPLFADFTHDNGNVGVTVPNTPELSSMIWPYTTSSAMDQLFSMSFLTAVNSSSRTGITSSYTATPTNNSFADGTTQTSRVFFTGRVADYSVSVEQIVRTYATSVGLKTNSVEIQYKVKNTSSDGIDNLYLGNYFDFDLPNLGTNVVGYDAPRNMYYSRTADSTVFVGVRVISGATHSAHFRRYADAFNRSYASVSDGVQDTNVANAQGIDVTLTVSQKFTSVNPGATVSYAVGIFFGSTLSDIQTVSDAAFAQYGGLGGGGTAITVTKDVIYTGTPSLDATPTSSGGGCLLKP